MQLSSSLHKQPFFLFLTEHRGLLLFLTEDGCPILLTRQLYRLLTFFRQTKTETSDTKLCLRMSHSVFSSLKPALSNIRSVSGNAVFGDGLNRSVFERVQGFVRTNATHPVWTKYSKSCRPAVIFSCGSRAQVYASWCDISLYLPR